MANRIAQCPAGRVAINRDGAHETPLLVPDSNPLRAGSGIGSLAGLSLAAVFGEIGEQAIHPGEIGAIDQIASLLLDADQAGVREFLQMEGQGIARNAELFGQDAGHEAGQAGHNEGAESSQTLRMGKGAQG